MPLTLPSTRIFLYLFGASLIGVVVLLGVGNALEAALGPRPHPWIRGLTYDLLRPPADDSLHALGLGRAQHHRLPGGFLGADGNSDAKSENHGYRRPN